MRRITGDNGSHVVSYGRRPAFPEAGWSTVVCGPGDIAQAHQPDEYIEVSELEAGERLLRRIIATLCLIDRKWSLSGARPPATLPA